MATGRILVSHHFVANYFFNYAGGGVSTSGCSVAKFGYLGTRSPSETLAASNPTHRPSWIEDYTYQQPLYRPQ